MSSPQSQPDGAPIRPASSYGTMDRYQVPSATALSPPPRRSGSIRNSYRPPSTSASAYSITSARTLRSPSVLSNPSTSMSIEANAAKHARRRSIPNVSSFSMTAERGRFYGYRDFDVEGSSRFAPLSLEKSPERAPPVGVKEEENEEEEAEKVLEEEEEVLDASTSTSEGSKDKGKGVERGTSRERRSTNASTSSSVDKTSLISSSIMEETEPELMANPQFSTSSVLLTPFSSTTPSLSQVNTTSYRTHQSSSSGGFSAGAYKTNDSPIEKPINYSLPTSIRNTQDPQSPTSLTFEKPDQNRNSTLTVQPNVSKTDLVWNEQEEAEVPVTAEKEPKRREGSADASSWMFGVEDSCGSSLRSSVRDGDINSIAHSIGSSVASASQSQSPTRYNSRQVARERIYHHAPLDFGLADMNNMSPTEQQYRRIVNEYQAIQASFKRTKEQIEKKLTTDEKIALGNAVNKLCDFRAYKVNWEAYNRKEIHKFQLEAHMEFPQKLNKSSKDVVGSSGPGSPPSASNSTFSSTGSGTLGRKLFKFGGRRT
ncbi:hypothetical protein BT69DRAFT_1337857 [Atractiella rhizophila]|nr:hypothetical protein BT69DRAFT_1337857 [Atractiella rhizophila]